MKITELQVITYILNCIRIRTKPCKYFQLNSPHFDRQEGIFSKKDIDQLIPEKWRLHQQIDDGKFQPDNYPVFVKPEWGQNASGVFRADDANALAKIRCSTDQARTRCLIQQGAIEKREFELFSILHHQNKNNFAVLTVTEAINTSESNPVNSVYNANTAYEEITEQFSEQQKQTLWQLIGQIGRFNISRVSVRADSIEDVLDGNFHIIEVNLFAPMPINMLDRKYSNAELWQMIRRYMLALARITKYRDKSLEEKPVFIKIMLYNRKNTALNFIRNRI
jgi:D-alanine-D-alanine ligase-like ATP-grasp enzyme